MHNFYISYAVSYYASHPLCANVQLYDIEKLCIQLKYTHPSFIWFQTTQNKIHMRYREGQVDYYGKKRNEFVGIYVDKVVN